MSGDPLQGLPGGEPVQQVIAVTKQIVFTGIAVADPQPQPDGTVQVAFIAPQTSEVLIFVLPAEAADKLGKQLIAPRVALPNGNSGGLRPGP